MALSHSNMRKLIVKQFDYDLTPVAGLALVGHYLKAVRPVLDRLDAVLPMRTGVSNSDVCRAYLGLLAQHKLLDVPNGAVGCPK